MIFLCFPVSRQEEKLQKVIIGEERFLGKDPSPGITYDPSKSAVFPQ